jgi:hypothetical protein
MKRLLAPSLFCLVLALPTIVPMGGCQGGGPFAAFDPRAQAMAALSEAMKQSVRTYLSGLEGVVTELKQVKDLASAVASLDKVKPYYNDVQKAMPELKKISGKDLENVRMAFGPELEKAAKDFEGQAERLTGSGSIGTVMKAILDQIKPFK